VQRMQKALTEMNLQIHRVISDITGLTGMSILRAIIAGERDSVKLARLKYPQIRSSVQQQVLGLSKQNSKWLRRI
jgi:transposase